MKTDKWAICPLCGVEENLTWHHTLFPRRKWANHPLREELKILICRECHDLVHDHLKLMHNDQTRFHDHKRYREVG